MYTYTKSVGLLFFDSPTIFISTMQMRPNFTLEIFHLIQRKELFVNFLKITAQLSTFTFLSTRTLDVPADLRLSLLNQKTLREQFKRLMDGRLMVEC